MIRTYHFETELSGRTFRHTIYSNSVETSIKKWVNELMRLQDEVYSFPIDAVKQIADLHQKRKLNIQIGSKPRFISFTLNEVPHFCYIHEADSGEPDFIAVLTYRTTEQRGRKTPARSGYRPQVKFYFSDHQTSGQQIFVDRDIVFPGETVEAEIKMLTPLPFENKLIEGMEFEFREGATIIGIGKILTIVNERLRK